MYIQNHKVRDDYNNNRPNRNDWQRAVNRAVNCMELIKKAIDASDDDDEEDITRYENLIVINDFIIDLKAYSDYNSTYRNYSLTDYAKTTRRQWKREWQDRQ